MSGWYEYYRYHNPGISWAGTSDEDAAYRTKQYTGDLALPYMEGFNLSQWFTDQGIDGDHSYYRYAKIRQLSDAQFQAGAGGYWNLVMGTAYGALPLSSLYSYAGTIGADKIPVAAQNINTLTSKGLDTWGRPLPPGFQTPESLAAKRLVHASSVGGEVGGGGILSGPTAEANPLSLGNDETLGKK